MFSAPSVPPWPSIVLGAFRATPSNVLGAFRAAMAIERSECSIISHIQFMT
jgi:hypothetical protein